MTGVNTEADGKWERLTERLLADARLPARMEEELRAFLSALRAMPGRHGAPVKAPTRYFYAVTLVRLGRYLADKGREAFEAAPYEPLTGEVDKIAEELLRQDITDFIRGLELDGRRPPSTMTRAQHVARIRRFYRWLYGERLKVWPEDQYPPCVSGLRKVIRLPPLEERSRVKRKSELLTPEDIERLLRACEAFSDRLTRLRNKAIIAVLADTGVRPGELLSLRIRDVRDVRIGGRPAYELTVYGKTGHRVVYVVDGYGYLRAWLEAHPRREDPEAPLFCALGRKVGRPLARRGLRKLIEKAVRVAGLNKRVYPYLFRHSRLTGLAEAGVSEPMLKEWAGWTKGSPMPSVYIHFSGRETRRVVAELLGVPEEPEEPTVGVLPLKTCPACGRRVEPDRLYCPYCDSPLSGTVGVILAHERVEELKSELEGLRLRLKAMEELLRGLTSALLGARGPEAEAARVRAIAALTPRSISGDIAALLPRELVER